MEILNSGSFVPLDNRNKIEQLIFTAKTLATEVSRAEGFQSSGSTNHQLGLEMWKGAEYMCRAHEEANIRNLFLSKFLETLREIERQSAGRTRPPQTQIVNPATVCQLDPAHVPVQSPTPQVVPDLRPLGAAEDEYLGIIPKDAGIETERPSYADECMPEYEAEIAAMNADAEKDKPVITGLPEDEPTESTTTETPATKEAIATDSQVAENNESDSKNELVGDGPDAAESSGTNSSAIDSIVLAEKEPYNFDSCTVTAVIQLLPETDGIRKCVVSVRSHDFVPQISISELRSGEISEDANRSLADAIAGYRTELPVLASEKIKKEKPAGKKRTVRSNDKGTKAASAADPNKPTNSISPPAAQNSEAVKDQRNLFAS